MKRLLPSIVCFLLFVASSWHAGAAPALEPKLLAEFARDGLPDARGAKWVRAVGAWGSRDGFLPGDPTGNAWLVREAPDGTVELIVNQTRLVRARRVESKNWELLPPGMTPREVEIRPANLQVDIARIAKGLEELDDRTDHSKRVARITTPPFTLLFLAHLQRRGDVPAVRRLLPKVLALSGKLPVDGAVALLADARLLEVDTEWAKKGDARAYAARLDALVTRFPTSWAERPYVTKLAELVRAQKQPTAPARNPREAAALVLYALRPQHLAQLPVGINWLVPAEDTVEHSTDYAAIGLDSYGDPPPTRNGPPWVEVENDGNPADARQQNPDRSFVPIRAFFLRHGPSAAALADLLDDHRVLRVLSEGRPWFMGEMAELLLRGLAPGKREFHGLPPKAADLRDWARSLATMNDEQVAAAYLRSGSRAIDVLSYAAGHPTPENLILSRRAFLDAESWRAWFPAEGWPEPLRRFVKALGPDRDAFAEELLALVASDAFSSDERMAEIKVVLHPPALDGLLTQMGAADREQATKLMRTVILVLGPRFDEETEARILQAAASAPSADGKGALLAFFNPEGWRGEHRFDLPGLQFRGFTFPQPAAQRALATLLQDQTPLPQFDDWFNETPTVAEVVIDGILSTRGGPSDPTMSQRQELRRRRPAAAADWQRAMAEAITSGQPIPPFPKIGRTQKRQGTKQ